VSAVEDVARMLTLVPWLLERQGASLEETARTFGVDVRTIRRDLDHLDFCGLPGLGGGDLFDVSVVGDRVVVAMADELRRPLRPTPREALRLVLTLDAVAESMGEELPALRSAVRKVRAALGIPETVADVLPTGPMASVPMLRRAIADRQQVRLAYQGRGDDAPQVRVVDPWALHVMDGAWYLQGHDHGADDLRTFRLDRVADVEVLDAIRTVDAPSTLPPPRYVPGPDDLEVVLEVAVEGRWLLDAVDADEVDDHDDGSVRVRLRTDEPGWLARLVLTAGGDARVVDPASLRDDVATRAGQALAAYGSD
jgi:proteasome accessory factor C